MHSPRPVSYSILSVSENDLFCFPSTEQRLKASTNPETIIMGFFFLKSKFKQRLDVHLAKKLPPEQDLTTCKEPKKTAVLNSVWQ